MYVCTRAHERGNAASNFNDSLTGFMGSWYVLCVKCYVHCGNNLVPRLFFGGGRAEVGARDYCAPWYMSLHTYHMPAMFTCWCLQEFYDSYTLRSQSRLSLGRLITFCKPAFCSSAVGMVNSGLNSHVRIVH